jgi:hypothetical protein
MSATLGSFSSIAASASGLEDTQPSLSDDEMPTRPTPPSKTSTAAPAETSSEKWWEWLTHKAEDVEGWVEGFISEHVGGNKEGKKDE